MPLDGELLLFFLWLLLFPVVSLLLVPCDLDGFAAGAACPFAFFRRTFFVLGSLLSFFHFIRRFWNQIFICRSDNTRVWAISIRRRLVRYLL